MIKRFLVMTLMCAMAFSMAACNTTGIDASIAKQLPKLCDNARIAHVAFVGVASVSDKIKPSVVASEAAAFDSIQPICDNPSNQNLATVLVTASLAYAKITAALKEAKRVQAT